MEIINKIPNNNPKYGLIISIFTRVNNNFFYYKTTDKVPTL